MASAHGFSRFYWRFCSTLVTNQSHCVVRAMPEGRDSRLVAVTGYGTKADSQAFEQAGFDHYFPKPTNIEELNRILAKPQFCLDLT